MNPWILDYAQVPIILWMAAMLPSQGVPWPVPVGLVAIALVYALGVHASRKKLAALQEEAFRAADELRRAIDREHAKAEPLPDPKDAP